MKGGLAMIPVAPPYPHVTQTVFCPGWRSAQGVFPGDQEEVGRDGMSASASTISKMREPERGIEGQLALSQESHPLKRGTKQNYAFQKIKQKPLEEFSLLRERFFLKHGYS